MFELARRCASSLEQSNDQSDAIIRIQTDMHALSMKRYEYERLNSDRFAERERAQHALHARVTELEKRDHTAWHAPLVNLSDRLNAALQRIEQLEADVARLTGPRPVTFPQCEHDWEEPLGSFTTCTKCSARKLATIAGPVIVTSSLPASPATAYPPLTDEGT